MTPVSYDQAEYRTLFCFFKGRGERDWGLLITYASFCSAYMNKHELILLKYIHILKRLSEEFSNAKVLKLYKQGTIYIAYVSEIS